MGYVEKIGPSFVVEANIGPRLSWHGSKWPIHLFICQDRVPALPKRHPMLLREGDNIGIDNPPPPATFLARPLSSRPKPLNNFHHGVISGSWLRCRSANADLKRSIVSFTVNCCFSGILLQCSSRSEIARRILVF